MKIEIKSRFTDSVLFSHDCENNTIKITVIIAVDSRADLSGAYLSRAKGINKNKGGEEMNDIILKPDYMTVSRVLTAYVKAEGEKGLTHIFGILHSIMMDRPICEHYLLRRGYPETYLDAVGTDKGKASVEKTYEKTY
jgi:hypothetical protein